MPHNDVRVGEFSDRIAGVRAKRLAAILLAAGLSEEETADLIAQWSVKGVLYDDAEIVALERWSRSPAGLRVLRRAFHQTKLPSREREDCFQVALSRLFQVTHAYVPARSTAGFEAWAARVAVNAMRTYGRQFRREPPLTSSAAVEDAAYVDVTDDSLYVSWLRQQALEIDRFWGDVYVSCVLDDKPKEQLAIELNVPYRTFARRFKEIREQLADRVQRSRRDEESQ